MCLNISLSQAEQVVDRDELLLAHGLRHEIAACYAEFVRLGAEVKVRLMEDIRLSEATPEDVFWELQSRAGLTFVFIFKEDGDSPSCAASFQRASLRLGKQW